MVGQTQAAIGLSVGATNLAAVTADGAVARRPMLTLYQHRRSEVGVPAENPNLAEPGLVITDFVNRMGQTMAAADGSLHRAEDVLADGLRALVHAASTGRLQPTAVTVTHPAHWPPRAVEVLRRALTRVPEWSHGPQLVSDAAAALCALRATPGVPARGIVAVCDFGGSGCTITVVDAAADFQPVRASVRYGEFSGELIDQALLNHVLTELSLSASVTSAIGSLAGLRAQCRHAKEALSIATTTEVQADLIGFHGVIEVSRADLDDAIRRPLDGVLAVLRDTVDQLDADLVAVAAVGGGANVPAITTALSEQFQVPVIMMPRPQLAAATGAAMLAARRPAVVAAAAADDPAATSPPPAAQPESAPQWLDDEPGSFLDLTGRRRRWRPAILGAVLVLLAVGAALTLLLRPGAPGTPVPPAVTTTPPTVTVRPTAPTTPVAPSSTLPAPPPVSTTDYYEPAPTTTTIEPTTTTAEPTTTTPTTTTPVTTTPVTTTPVTTTSTSPESEVPHIPGFPGAPHTPAQVH